MQKERFQIDRLKNFYKFRFVCEKCGVPFGSDSNDKKTCKKISCPIACPFCRRLKWRLENGKRGKANSKNV